MAISESALRAVRDRGSLFAFLKQELRWPVDDEDPEPLTYPGPRLKPDLAGSVTVSQIVPFGTGDRYAIMLAEFSDGFRRGALREILRSIRAEIRKEAKYGGRGLEELLFLCATDGYEGVRFVRFEEREGRAPKLSAFGWTRGETDGARTLRDLNLPALEMPPRNLLGEFDWTRARWEEAWSVEKVTKSFFGEYRDIFNALLPQVQGVRGSPRLVTQRLCNRLMFIQFLAKKGWLNHDRSYLGTLYEIAREHAARPGARAAGRSNFYSEFLHPLFFTALNTPTAERPDDATWSALSERLGDVPFLNGGLFSEQDGDDREGALTIANDAFAPLLDLFDRFNFTLTESTPDDVEVAVDPEMLGKVFEELVTADERHGTGSYYTPRAIVSFMCREALKGYLARDESAEAAARFVDRGEPDDLRDPEAVLSALKRIAVCDPACGSGAYLLGMMQELLRLREALFAAKVRDFRRIYERKLEIIQRNLYGVDKEPFAVNIAMLRLWLSLVVDDERNPLDDPTVDVSLPNLRFKIQEGDALTAPIPDLALFGDEYIRDAARLRALHDEYFEPPHPGRPKRAKEAIEGDIDAQQQKIAGLLGSQAAPGAVDWCVRFAEVFAPIEATTSLGGALNLGTELAEPAQPGGFDVVLANPPYVRQELITEQKPALKAAHPAVYTGTADLYVYFYSRALELLRPGGMLSFISSNKWFRAGYGAKLRAHIAGSAAVRSITDFGDLPVFQAAIAYPMVFVAQRAAPTMPAAYTKVRSLAAPYPDVLALVERDGIALPASAIQGGSWTLTNSASADRLLKMESAGTRLGEYVNGQIYRGVLTGFNEAFVISGAKRAELIDQDPNSAEIIKPLATGKDVRRWCVDLKDKWLIVTRIGVQMSRYPAVFAHLDRWRPQLEARRDKGEHWWELRACAYYDVFDQPKIMYPEVSLEPRFALDLDSVYPLKTCFSIRGSDRFLVGVVNSASFSEYQRERQNTVRGGYLMNSTIYIEATPVPSAAQADRLAVAALVQKCLDAKGVGCEAWEGEIDARVAALYGL